METIRGRRSLELHSQGFKERLSLYKDILLDLGTGDGRFVLHSARQRPGWLVIGIDPCRENLHEHSRSKMQNLLFIIARAQEVPQELNGLCGLITINFPWGSLLESLLSSDCVLPNRLSCLARSNARLEICLNSGALIEAGRTDNDMGVEKIMENLNRSGWLLDDPARMNAGALKQHPTTWARRLAFGRDPRALKITGRLAAGDRRF